MTADAFVLSLMRLEFGIAASFHYLFVPLSLGLMLAVALIEAAHWRTGCSPHGSRNSKATLSGSEDPLACRRPWDSPRRRPLRFPTGGRRISPWAAIGFPRILTTTGRFGRAGRPSR